MIQPTAAAVGEAGVWFPDLRVRRDAHDAEVGRLWRLDPVTSLPGATVAVGGSPAGVAVGYGSVWVANSTSGTVSRIEPRTTTLARTVRLGGSPTSVAAGAGLVWVAVA